MPAALLLYGIASLADAYEHQIAVDPEQIIITSGANAALQLALLSSFAPGDSVAIARPGYRCTI
jgi:DNA-binding transcriptional MocR family regulator